MARDYISVDSYAIYVLNLLCSSLKVSFLQLPLNFFGNITVKYFLTAYIEKITYRY